MLLAQQGEAYEFILCISDCFLTVQLGGFKVLLAFEMTLSRNARLGAGALFDFDWAPMGDRGLARSAALATFAVFLTLVSVFYSISTMSAKLKGSDA